MFDLKRAHKTTSEAWAFHFFRYLFYFPSRIQMEIGFTEFIPARRAIVILACVKQDPICRSAAVGDENKLQIICRKKNSHYASCVRHRVKPCTRVLRLPVLRIRWVHDRINEKFALKRNALCSRNRDRY